MNRTSIIDLDLSHLGTIYIIKATAEADGRTHIAVEALDLKSFKGDALAIAIRDACEKAKTRAVSALTGESQPDLQEPPLELEILEPPSNVTSIHQHTWKCDYNKKLKILNLWNKAKSLGYTEHELRRVLLGYNITSRKELDNQQADTLISFLAEAVNTALKNQKGAG
jgi:hypothetical protein